MNWIPNPALHRTGPVGRDCEFKPPAAAYDLRVKDFVELKKDR
jgi:hypothetical protein